MEGLGYACPDNGLIFAINASTWTVAIPILLHGTESQKRRYLPGLCDGSIVGANGASEPEAGSDIFGMQATAVRDRRRLDPGRPQDLGDERPGGRPLRLLCLDRARSRDHGDLGVRGAQGCAGVPGGPRDPQDGRPHGADGGAGVRGCRLAGRCPARPRRARGRGLQRLDGMGARVDPGLCPGDDAAAARALRRARPEPQAVRPGRSASSRRSPTGSSR